MFFEVNAVFCFYFLDDMVDKVVDRATCQACDQVQACEGFVAIFLVPERYIQELDWLSEVICAPRRDLAEKKVLCLDSI